ncbi:hypothetical protein [Chitinophaga sp. Cy-1792]|uniref:hypothetical protein n=1 Tax=Chitinophaga sp. Cy-1792 TaxID=2608339 RepID=UPI00141F3A24|nr:hypothetical protein [Chitinophaga sp. Cy-1792]NIG54268.1 hypothetical protein [Chitinophaga sp. Cy-1792]
MKPVPFIVLPCLLIMLLMNSSCSKKADNIAPVVTPPPAQTNFFANTAWSGTYHTQAQNYDAPCVLFFRGDTVVVIYGMLHFAVNGNPVAANLFTKDSIQGKITKIDNLSATQATITVQFDVINEQQMLSISQTNYLTGGPSDPSKFGYNSMQTSLRLCPNTGAMTIKNTTWNTPVITYSGPANGMHMYPDLSAISFDETNETFLRNGAAIAGIGFKYKQVGPMVNLAGYNDDPTIKQIIPYFGALSPNADTMWVTADFGTYYPRLPNPVETIHWYGLPGVTPLIFKTSN